MIWQLKNTVHMSEKSRLAYYAINAHICAYKTISISGRLYVSRITFIGVSELPLSARMTTTCKDDHRMHR